MPSKPTSHRRLHGSRTNDSRLSARQRGYDSRWEKARRIWLAQHPFCHYCKEKGLRGALATVVDHFVPHKGDQGLFWDQCNWRSSCVACHNAKTAREDGGFGRAMAAAGGG